MSLINQMLQDLEARGKQGQTVAPMPTEVRPVLPPPRTNQMWIVVLGLALLLLVLVIWMVPRQNRGPAPHNMVPEPPATIPPVARTAPAQPVAQATPVAATPAAQATPVATLPAAQATPVATMPAAPSPQNTRAPLSTARASSPTASSPTATVPDSTGPSGAVAGLTSEAGTSNANGKAQGSPVDGPPLILKLIPELTSLTRPENAKVPGKPKAGHPSGAESAFIDVVAPGQARSVANNATAPSERNARAAVAPTGTANDAGKQTNTSRPSAPADNSIKLVRQPLSPQQRAENEYRKALQAQQAGRQQEAMTYLEQALQFDHQHTAARQAMVAWLLEQGQRPQAIAKLQEGLGHDPAQSGLAMILARLQVDQGDVKTALDTLNRSLPYTLGRADYQAFMAALLQREGRHKEAILRYQNALAINPDSAVWWMGIAISLQAEQQKAAARESFSRARGIGGLSPELQAFVEQRISQLQ